MTTPVYQRILILVPIADTDWANSQAVQFDPDTGGASTFGRVRFSPTGRTPATHSGCCTAAEPGIVAAIQSVAATRPGVLVYAADDDAAVATALSKAGLSLIRDAETMGVA